VSTADKAQAAVFREMLITVLPPLLLCNVGVRCLASYDYSL
jgi:hypothetical protein